MTGDLSNGWDAIAGTSMAARSRIGADVVRRWARHLPPGGAVVDVGCGAGIPISETLIGEGFQLFALDASPALVAAFRRRFPGIDVACEAAQDSPLFGRQFDGAVAIGLLFLLTAADQRRVIHRVAGALVQGGRFLFSAPRSPATWHDSLTGRPSLSLGIEEYRLILADCGLRISDSHEDEGANHYIDAVKDVP